MRMWARVVACCVFSIWVLASSTSLTAQKQLARSPKILLSKTLYFWNTTGSDAVATRAVAQLKRWGRFQLKSDPKTADLLLVLSADAYRGGNVIVSGGQTGTVDDQGHIKEDKVPDYNKQPPTRYAYLTVVDAQTGDNLWSDQHLWGGLLTGFDSVGARLVKEFEKQMKK